MNQFTVLIYPKSSSLLSRIYAIKGSSQAEIIRLLTKARKHSPENPYYMLHSIVEKTRIAGKIVMPGVDEYASSHFVKS
jgi:copper homeostasis protein CutC